MGFYATKYNRFRGGGGPCEFEIDCHEEELLISFVGEKKMTGNMKGERFRVSIHRQGKMPCISEHAWLFAFAVDIHL